MRRLILILIVVWDLGVVRADTPAPPTEQKNLGNAFRVACWNGNLDKATELLNQGAPLEGRDSLGRTPLFLASHGDPDIVKLLLAHGAKIDAAENDGDQPISHACEFGDLASAKMLLDAGADFNVVNKYGHTPLILAAREGRDELVSLLIDHKVNVNFEGPGSTALFFAIWKDHVSTAKLLLDAGADPKILYKAPDPKIPRTTFLTWAATTDDTAMVDLLLDHGVDINERSEDGTTALMVAIKAAKPGMIADLLEKSADPNLQDKHGSTALMLSMNYQQEPVWQNLLDHGAKLEIADEKGHTALIWACHYAYNPAIRFLIEHGADIDATDSRGETPLTYAGDRGDVEMAQFLKDKGAKRTDVHIIARRKPESPLPPAYSWALAVGAIYPQTNGINPQVLGYEDPESVAKIQKSLKEDWNVTDKETFLKEIDDLRHSGHHAQFQELGAKLAAIDDTKFDEIIAAQNIREQVDECRDAGPEDKDLATTSAASPDMTTQAKAMRDSYLKWKERCGLAWDYCRAANLVSRGYNAHYIDEKEAWDLLEGIAQQTQGSFTSWQEMSDNFLDGREIWANERDPRFEACAQLLLNPQDPNSPWNQNPWKTDLTAPAGN